MNSNRYYEAMLEGRYRPTVEIETIKNGNFRAHWTDGMGKTIEFVDNSANFAQHQLNIMIREAVKNGEMVPF